MAERKEPLSLGFLAADWIAWHCVVPDGFALGDPLVHRGWQLFCDVMHYEVKPGIEFNPARPVQGQAFVRRRSVVVGPQKVGKSPWLASLKLFEADGPCLFAGWARGGEQYRCVDNGCGCGFVFEYRPGDPMGMRRPKALIQLLATAEDQTDNVYLPMQTMVRGGALADRLRVLEDRIATQNGGKIEPVTAKSTSRLGAPINDAGADESGLYTQRNGVLKTWQTMLRGLGGMDGRSIETTNPWDPMENSSAQQAFLSKASDVWVFYRKPPSNLSYRDKRERRKIHEFVYEGSPWVNLDSVDAVASELLETDPEQAMRFYGNMLVQGLGSYMPEELWDERTDEVREVPQSGRVCGGLDPSINNDWTAIRLETLDGFRFTPTYGPDSRPAVWNPALWGGEIPRGEMRAAVDEVFRRYEVERFYVDSLPLASQIEDWQEEHGDAVAPMPTHKVETSFQMLVRLLEDLRSGVTTHDACPYARDHALNARRVAKSGDRYVIGKPADHQKIDVLMADALAHLAASDARAHGWSDRPKETIFFLPR